MRFRLSLFLSLGLALGAQALPGHKEVIPVTDKYPDDPALVKVIEPLKAEIKATFDLVIAHAPKGLMRAAGKENQLGYWVTDAMRLRASALLGVPVKVGYTNSGGLRANIRPGAVKVADIYEVMPFENELMVAEVTGAELVRMVREAVLRRAVEPMSGVKVATAGSVEDPQLLVTWEDGSAIGPDEVVKLATSDYLLASSDVLKKARNPVTTGITLRQVLLDVCRVMEGQGKAILPPEPGRMSLDPDILQALKTSRARK
jgi:2',3'-cyclic-nucleotide 2'-phosphodiesterase (5'-nucleotidase family)